MIIGHARTQKYFERLFRTGRFHHGYLFSGPSGVGKRTFARALAAGLLCPKKSAVHGCGECDDCRLVAAGTHPDLIILSRDALLDESEDRIGIGIKNAQALRSRMAQTPMRGMRNVVIIDDAELLTTDAQSALLKTLEEPSGRTIVFAISSREGALLQTIRSRMIPFSFELVLDEDMKTHAKAYGKGTAAVSSEDLLRLSHSRPGRLFKLMADREFLREARAEDDVISAMAKGRATLPSDADDPRRFSVSFAFLLEALRRDLFLALGEPREARMRAVALELAEERSRSADISGLNRKLIADEIRFAIAASLAPLRL